MTPESNAYTLAQAIRLRGALNPAALEQSINDVIRRHESVRTTFTTINDDPVQVIAPFAYFSLPLVDLSSLSNQSRESEVLRIASAEAERPFDLQRGPLLRAVLLFMDHDDYVLLFTMHHIVSDGWSMGVLVNEVTSSYEAFNNGSASPLSDLEIQYADFALWQRQWLTGDTLARQLNYWSEQLRDTPPLLALPTDHVRPKVLLTEGATYESLIGTDLTTDLKSLSQQSGVTLFMTMLASFHALLHRYAQQATILTGTPVANRTRGETEPLIGFFVNTLVLRSDFADDPAFSTLLARLRQHALAAYAHQDLPFELLVDELQLPRDLSYNPLFQVMFNWEEAVGTALQLTSVELSALAVENPTSQFDLTLTVAEAGGQLRCSVQYNTALFVEATIERMLDHYEELLRSIVREPHQRVSRLELLPRDERRLLLRDWNDTAVESETDVTLSQLFERQVKRDAAAVAVVSGETETTYGELNERANRIARRLRDSGVGPDARVGLLLERGVETVVGLLGILKAGAAYVPLDASYPRARLDYMVNDAAVSVVLTESRFQSLAMEIAPSGSRVLCLNETSAADGSGANLTTTIHSENLAYIMYTSGSTGQPKGVMISHRNVSNLFTSLDKRLLDEGPGTFLAFTSTSFDISVVELLWTLTRGFRVVMQKDRHQLLSDRTDTSDESLAAQLKRHQVSHLQCTPSLAQTLLVDSSTRAALGSLRHWMLGGEAVSRELANEIKSIIPGQLHNGYGPTETTIYSSFNSAVIGEQTMPIGKPPANTEIYLLDQHFEPAPVGVPGEIYIGGVGVGRGYWQRPELTAERFLPDMFGERNGGRLYRTGDLARYLPDGNIEFLGRIDQQVKLRGFRIELSEIEVVLKQHASVREAVVVIQDIGGGERKLAAYVQLRARGEVAASELRAYLQERLPDHMVPASFVEVSEFALTPSGKIDRRALPAVKTGAAESEYEAPHTPTEELLTTLWANVLQLDRVGVNDNFFELGGHSLLATQLISRMRETFGRNIAVRHLFEQPTPAGLARVVDEALRETQQRSLPKLSPVSRDMDLPLSFAQRRLWLLEQLEASGNSYHLPGGLRFRGPLNIAAIEQSLAEVIRRHEALRTTFVTRNGQPRQIIADVNPVLLSIVDLSAVNESERVVTLQKLGVEEARRPFDLRRDPLLRVCLFRLSDEDHVGLFTMHHIVSDAWSMNLLLNELTTLYTAFNRGETSTLPELKIQYPDFAVWQQTYLAGEPLSEQLDYWKRQLAGAPALLNLSVDRPRPPAPSYRGAQEVLMLTPEISAGVNELCRRENVTPFMVLLASFKLLLSWYTGQDDIVVGAPIAGRNQVETEALVGFFVNTLVLRTKLSGNPDFREVLRRVRETSIGAYAHQDVPFEMLVETLTPERSVAHSPLFQVVVGLQNIPVTAKTDGDLTFEEFFRNVETAHYDLELTIMQAQQRLFTTLTYKTDLFDAATIRRMLNLWQRFLAYLIAHPDAGLTVVFEELNELDQQERMSAEAEFKETALQQLKEVRRRVVTHAG